LGVTVQFPPKIGYDSENEQNVEHCSGEIERMEKIVVNWWKPMSSIKERRIFFFLLPGLFSLLSCSAGLPSQSPDNDVTVVFCPPCKEKIPKLLREAKKSIDIAMYDLSSESVIEEIINAHNKGVRIRIIIERGRHLIDIRKNLPGKDLRQRMWESGISMRLSKNDHISFHHKNMIIDGETVYVGSMNLNKNSMDTERFRENYLLIKDPTTVKQFSDHFESLLRYEPVSNDLHKSNNGMGIDTYFAPSKHFAAKIIGLVNNAKTHVDMSVNVLTHPPLVDAMIAAHKRGVRVRITLSFYKSWVKYDVQVKAVDKLRKAGLDVRLDRGKENHNKILIIDESIVQTGSPGYNSLPLVRRYETATVVYSKTIAKQFLKSTRPFHEKAIKVGMDFDISSY
jgi:phosphatidylserine/phosphatidylglycerophosphate/cardiolipin synthase-like enzyme